MTDVIVLNKQSVYAKKCLKFRTFAEKHLYCEVASEVLINDFHISTNQAKDQNA